MWTGKRTTRPSQDVGKKARLGRILEKGDIWQFHHPAVAFQYRTSLSIFIDSYKVMSSLTHSTSRWLTLYWPYSASRSVVLNGNALSGETPFLFCWQRDLLVKRQVGCGI